MIKIKTKKMLNRLSELLSTGYTNGNIATILNKEFDAKMTGQSVNNLLKKQAILKKQVISTDKEFEELHKEILMGLLKKSEQNMNVLEMARGVLLEKFEELKKDIPTSKLMTYMKEISTAIRTQNDSIRSMAELLKRMETETSSIELNAVQVVQETVKMLKDLEGAGYIEIQPAYYQSNLYKEVNRDNNGT